MCCRSFFCRVLTGFLLLFSLSLAAASAQQGLISPRSRIVSAIDDAHVTPLTGNTHPLARPEFDQGTLDANTPLHRVVLVLQRSADQETALRRLLDQQQDRSSSTYHQWLTPEAFGASFGPSDRDLSLLTDWLSARGFTGIQINSGRTLVEFSGTVGTVNAAFHTSIHRYLVDGQTHYANATDPQIPAALTPVLAGLVSLNNFPRQPASVKAGNFRRNTVTGAITQLPDSTISSSTGPTVATAVHPSFTYGQQTTKFYAVTPYDFAAIYNVLPLWNATAAIDGTGQTIAIVGQTDINPADFVNFRKLFSLPLGNTATPTGTQYLNIIYNGPNPGVLADEGEANIDTQWSSAVAKGATIDYVVSASTEVTQGTDLSAAYIINNNLAPVMSYSYGQCELFLGASGNVFYNNLWQQASAQGITVLLASGDSGASGCDSGNVKDATHGLAVNGLGSTPYNVSVGGTDFNMPSGGTAFWNATNDPVTQASAKGYIPETTWNDSCTNTTLPLQSPFQGQLAEQICNSTARPSLLTVSGGGGGRSSCISATGTTSASCSNGYTKPAWQTGPGVPSDGVRDTPDVSFFASNGFYGAFYLVCQQSANPDGQPCSLAAPAYDFVGYGGTSVATPAFAGILSLVNQKTGSRQGNANYVLYTLAQHQAAVGLGCNAATGTPASGCIFNDLTDNTISMPCLTGSPDCQTTNSSDSYGVLTGWKSTAGYDTATGLGSVNAANLVNDWTTAGFVSSATSLALSASSVVHGRPVSATINVSSTSGTPSGEVTVNASAVNGAVAFGTLAAGTLTTSIQSFPGGSYTVSAHYAGNGTYAASDSNNVLLSVTPEASSTSFRPLLFNSRTGATTVVTTRTYGSLFLLRADVAGISGQGIATGDIKLTDQGVPLDGGSFRLTSSGYTEDQTTLLPPGTHTLVAAYSGDPSFNPSQASPASLTITQDQTATQISAQTATASQSGSFALTVKVLPQGDGMGLYPTGTITLNMGGKTLATATLTQSNNGSIGINLLASQLTAGSNAITASYSGDTNYSTSSSTGLYLTVNPDVLASSSSGLSLSASSVAPGGSLTATAVVTPSSPSPQGTVYFAIDGRQTSTGLLTAAQATALIATTGLAPGQHSVTATFSGDTNYKASVSTPVTFTIVGPTVASTTLLTLSPSSAVQGTTITLTTSVIPTTPSATGTAQLLLDGNAYGQPTILAAATATFQLPTTTLQPGPHTLQVLYSGDVLYLPSSSSVSTLNLAVPTGSFTVTSTAAAVSVSRGGTSQPITLAANSVDGFSSTITFSCSAGLPSGAACTFTPATVTPTPKAAAPTTTVTITTTAPPVQTARSQRSGHFHATGEAATLAGLLCFLFPRRRRYGAWVAVIAAFVLLTSVSGCGTGTYNPGTLSAIGGTPAGIYVVTVSATSISINQTTNITLTVQQ